MAQPKKKKPAQREPEQSSEPLSDITPQQKRQLRDMYRTVRKIVRTRAKKH
jgi:hypothetical protein